MQRSNGNSGTKEKEAKEASSVENTIDEAAIAGTIFEQDETARIVSVQIDKHNDRLSIDIEVYRHKNVKGNHGNIRGFLFFRKDFVRG